MIISVVAALTHVSLAAQVALFGASAATPSASFAERAAVLARQGDSTLTDAAIKERLTGMPATRTVDEEAIATMLRDAREHEARFEAGAAAALRREIVRAFAETLAPSASLRTLTATALHDLAAGLLAEGRSREALQRAGEALRRFADTPLDTRVNPPAVQQLFRNAAATLAGAPRYELSVTSDRPGEVWADGTRLGTVDTARTFSLSAGQYRVWLVWATGMSLPYPIDVSSSRAELRLDSELDQHLALTSKPSLRCPRDCAPALERLATRLRVDRCERVGTAGPLLGTMPPDAEPTTGSSSLAPYSLWWLVPFGVGQFQEHRPLAAAGVLTTELSFLAWNIAATYRYAQLAKELDPLAESWREQRNLSALLFWSSLLAGIAEAAVYGVLKAAPEAI